MQLMQEADANSDGKISYEEFNDMIRHFNYADKQSRHDFENPFTSEWWFYPLRVAYIW